MLDFIDNIRERPEKTRRRIAFFASAGTTGVIFFIWLLSFYVQADPNSNQIVAGKDNLSPVAALKANVASIFDAWSGVTSSIKNIPLGKSFEVTADPNSVVKPAGSGASENSAAADNSSTDADNNVIHWQSQ